MVYIYQAISNRTNSSSAPLVLVSAESDSNPTIIMISAAHIWLLTTQNRSSLLISPAASKPSIASQVSPRRRPRAPLHQSCHSRELSPAVIIMASDDECYGYESDYCDEDYGGEDDDAMDAEEDTPEPDRPAEFWVRQVYSPIGRTEERVQCAVGYRSIA